MAAHQPISPSATLFVVLPCFTLLQTEERVGASKSFHASWCRIGLNHSQEPLALIWIAAIILVKGCWWRASEAFHLHAASGGSSAQIGLECSSSRRGCGWCEVEQDAVRPRGRSPTCYGVSGLNSKSNETEPGGGDLLCRCRAAPLLQRCCRAGSHGIKQANEGRNVGGAA